MPVSPTTREGPLNVDQTTTDAATALSGDHTATTSSGTGAPSGVTTSKGSRKCHQAAPTG
jgi:hypothetical protein